MQQSYDSSEKSDTLCTSGCLWQGSLSYNPYVAFTPTFHVGALLDTVRAKGAVHIDVSKSFARKAETTKTSSLSR